MYNSVATASKKLISVRANKRGAAPADADEVNHYFLFRTGENVESVSAMLGLTKASATSGTDAAYCEMQLFDGTTTLTSGKVYQAAVSGASHDMVWGKVAIRTGLLANTEYRGHIRQYHYSRLDSATIYETASDVADSSVDGVVDPSYWETHKPIYDAGAQELAQTGTLLWRHNAAHLLSWTRIDAASAPVFAGTTQKNLLDTSLTGGVWSATSPGFVINTQYHDSFNGDVPVVLGVYATRTGGAAGLNIYVKRNGSTILTTTVGTAMAPFDSSAHTITARASDKIDIICASVDGLTTWRVDAVGLWEYEA